MSPTLSGLAIVRGRPSSRRRGPESHGIRQRRGSPCHPRRPPLHPELTSAAAIHVKGGVHAHRRHRSARGSHEAQLRHRVAGELEQEGGGRHVGIVVPELPHRGRPVMMVNDHQIQISFCQATDYIIWCGCTLKIWMCVRFVRCTIQMALFRTQGSPP